MSVLSIDFGETLIPGNVFLHLPKRTPGEFWEFCERNPDLQAEQNASGDIILYAPAGGETGTVNLRLARYLDEWAERDGSGIGFDSSTGFTLPSGTIRAPDAAWVQRTRWDALTDDERKKFPPLCPDFVLELLSESDRLPAAQEKMADWIQNGARLGWLIDRANRRVYVYRPGLAVEVLDSPATVSGSPELPGFLLPTARIFAV